MWQSFVRGKVSFMRKLKISAKFRDSFQVLAIVGGIFLVLEAVISLKYSQDTRLISDLGRYIRIIIGGATILTDGWFLWKT